MDLAARCEALEAENDRLRERVAMLERSMAAEFFAPVEWRLTPSEARLAGALYSRDVVTKDAAMAVLYRDNGKEEADQKIVGVFVCKIRRKLSPFGVEIKTRWGVGYFLPIQSKHRIGELLRGAS